MNKMSAAARIWKFTLATVKSKDTREYFMSTHFWGPLLNFGIPLAAISDMRKPADMISGKMTVALFFYSAASMRFAWMITPRNRLLFACHVINDIAQIIQGARFVHYHHFTSKENSLS